MQPLCVCVESSVIVLTPICYGAAVQAQKGYLIFMTISSRYVSLKTSRLKVHPSFLKILQHTKTAYYYLTTDNNAFK